MSYFTCVSPKTLVSLTPPSLRSLLTQEFLRLIPTRSIPFFLVKSVVLVVHVFVYGYTTRNRYGYQGTFHLSSFPTPTFRRVYTGVSVSLRSVSVNTKSYFLFPSGLSILRSILVVLTEKVTDPVTNNSRITYPTPHPVPTTLNDSSTLPPTSLVH